VLAVCGDPWHRWAPRSGRPEWPVTWPNLRCPRLGGGEGLLAVPRGCPVGTRRWRLNWPNGGRIAASVQVSVLADCLMQV